MSSTPRRIRVSTGARLHCGLLAPGAVTGRQFGGLGMMVDSPGFVLQATRADHDEVVGNSPWQQRLQRLTADYRVRVPMEQQPPPVRWELECELSPHAGLGSGTQLGLAAATALTLLAGERDVSALELARRCGRGLRSAVGLYGFSLGGLLVEGGKRSAEAISPLVTRVPIPEEWRFVLMRPRDAVGLSGAEERQRFADLGAMPEATTNRLCRLALLDIVPAVIEADCKHCVEGLAEFGRRVGEHFASVQGGVYADPQMRSLAERASARGVRGLCQSSWGPTLFALCPNALAAQSLMDELKAEAGGMNVEFTIAEPLNRGAQVEICV